MICDGVVKEMVNLWRRHCGYFWLIGGALYYQYSLNDVMVGEIESEEGDDNFVCGGVVASAPTARLKS